MSERSVIIVGAGLGGLECGLLLARSGWQVTVLEQGLQPGGAFQTFVRGGHRFDTGFHYAGGIDGVWAPLLRCFSLDSLPWHRLDEEAVEDIYIEDRKYCHPSGYGRFADAFSPLFGAAPVQAYLGLLRQVGEGKGHDTVGVSALDYLSALHPDPAFARVLGGASLRQALSPRLPLYSFARVQQAFIQGGWKLPGGGKTLIDRLLLSLEKAGGRALCGQSVQEILLRDGKACGVRTAAGESWFCDAVIADIHPSGLAGLVPSLRKSYRERMASLQNTRGVFTTHILLKKNCLPYVNRSIHIHRSAAGIWQGEGMMVHYYVPSDGGSRAEAVDILTTCPAPPEDGYAAWKEQLSAACIEQASQYITGLKEAVDQVFTSTPRTWERYTATPGGSAFGLVKDCTAPHLTFLSPKTPVPGLLLTGQNLALHGLPGVSMTALYTCSELLGKQIITDIL